MNEYYTEHCPVPEAHFIQIKFGSTNEHQQRFVFENGIYYNDVNNQKDATTF